MDMTLKNNRLNIIEHFTFCLILFFNLSVSIRIAIWCAKPVEHIPCYENLTDVACNEMK